MLILLDELRWCGYDELVEAIWARIREIIDDTAHKSGEIGQLDKR